MKFPLYHCLFLVPTHLRGKVFPFSSLNIHSHYQQMGSDQKQEMFFDILFSVNYRVNQHLNLITTTPYKRV